MKSRPKLSPRLREPASPNEWQVAAEAARACLILDAAWSYGIVTGGPGVDVDRCTEILRRAKALGVEPSCDALERHVNAWMEAAAEE